MKIDPIKVTLTFTEPVLGSASGNRDIHEEFIASKAPTIAAAEEEAAAIPLNESIEKASTIFPRDETGLFLWDYQIRGFIKESILIGIELGEVSAGLTKYNHKKAVDSLVFVNPRRIYYRDQAGQPIKQATKTLQRPLRAETMRGERVALARSEELPPGTNVSFEVRVLGCADSKKSKLSISRKDIEWAFNYGQLKGLGQWRSGGYGRFEWKDAA